MLLQHNKIEKPSLFNLNHCQKFSQLPVQCATANHNFGIVAVMLANTGKSQKCHRFELVQNLVYIFRFEIYSFSFVLNFFVGAKAGVVLNLFLNFEQT